MTNLIVEIKLLHPNAKRPEYQTEGAAGMDLFVENDAAPGCWPTTEHGIELPFCLHPKERYLLGTGIALSIPQGWEAQIRPRSGWALKSGITVLNSPGTIDSDYRGEIKVLLINLGSESVKIKRGDRIAQLVFAPVGRATLQPVERFSSETKRGDGSFGSTG